MINDFTLRVMQRLSPSILWYLYAKHCKKILRNTYFILSFDCDTDEDINVALEINKKLIDMGIKPVYAVPGELLRRGQKVYAEIKDQGCEFINHGGCEHTYFDTLKDRYASCFFYDQQSKEAIINDIKLGDSILLDVLGIKAKGWRTPHFGTFQSQAQLDFLYSILESMNYAYSSSTCPKESFVFGPSFKKGNIIEIPVTGVYSEPLNIMDTWAFFAAPERVNLPNDYLRASKQIADLAQKHPVLINIYGDPSHIYNKPEFFTAMQNIAMVAKAINFTEYLDIIHDNVRTI